MPDQQLPSSTPASTRQAQTPDVIPLQPSSSWWRRAWRKWQGVPPRYGLVILGSGLLMFAGSNRVIGATAGLIKPQVVLVVLASIAGLLSLIMAASSPFRAPPIWYRCYRWARYPIYTCGLYLILGTFVTFAGTLSLALQPTASQVYHNDVLSFTYVNAELVLSGRNPYTSDTAFRVALEQYPQALPSPLRRGILANLHDPPGADVVDRLRKLYIASPQATHGALDPRTLHSYPALSFLLYVPFLWAGVPNILLLNLLICAGVLVWIAWQAPAAWRLAALFSAGTGFCIVYSLPVDTEIVCIALLLAAWHLRERKWLAPVLLGLACAFKQYSWLFVPFIILEIWMTQGSRTALRWLGVVLAMFLLPNLPFIIMSPHAWLQSLFLPVSEPLFPQGIGIMSLSLGHLLPYGPPELYSVLEVLAFGGLVLLQLRYHRQLGGAVLLLAVIPLFFAFRSPPNYFAFVPWLALYAASSVYALRAGGQKFDQRGKGKVPEQTIACSGTPGHTQYS
jgi:hypothetical protein